MNHLGSRVAAGNAVTDALQHAGAAALDRRHLPYHRPRRHDLVLGMRKMPVRRNRKQGWNRTWSRPLRTWSAFRPQ